MSALLLRCRVNILLCRRYRESTLRCRRTMPLLDFTTDLHPAAAASMRRNGFSKGRATPPIYVLLSL